MSNRKGRSVFRARKGTLRVYKDRVLVQAILESMYNNFVKWPDPDE
jgi:hypothetical protein